MSQARCPKCLNYAFVITEEFTQCANCGEIFRFDFMDDAKTLCTTSASDIVIRVNEGK